MWYILRYVILNYKHILIIIVIYIKLLFAGAQLPYSPLRLGPDTSDSVADIDFRHYSGYNSFDSKIRMFSHTHLGLT